MQDLYCLWIIFNLYFFLLSFSFLSIILFFVLFFSNFIFIFSANFSIATWSTLSVYNIEDNKIDQCNNYNLKKIKLSLLWLLSTYSISRF
ncbi:unnamed protein product [Blepharisma stoltei]|uniref:Uncharacterized protein n=1 Tax=Blepharisma stoltei TaxID=1481888 RepID=A0AAU9J6E9_9CILI|nr:unnamed protein product [Blepharisma stoltei]